MEAQVAACLAYVERQGWIDVMDVRVLEEVISSRKAFRPVLDGLLAEVRVDGGTVVVAAQDRLCRDLGEFVAILKEVGSKPEPQGFSKLLQEAKREDREAV